MFTDYTTGNALNITANPNPASFTSANLTAGQSTYFAGLTTLSSTYSPSGTNCGLFGCYTSSSDDIGLAFTWTAPSALTNGASGTVDESQTIAFHLFAPSTTTYDGTLHWTGDSHYDASLNQYYAAQTITFSNGAQAEVDLYDTKLTGTSSALAAQFDMKIKDIKDPVRVPEPASLALLGAGMLGLGYARRRKA